MPRKETITREKLLSSAFELVREKGALELSARHLAAQAGCSTQPIFRLYRNMDELERDLFDRLVLFFNEFYRNYPGKSEVPFVNLGMSYISFARQYKNFFMVLFIDNADSGKSMYDLVNGGKDNFVINEIRKIEGVTPDAAGEIFSKMWIFIHGIACMVIRNDFDLSDEETAEMLSDMFRRIHDTR